MKNIIYNFLSLFFGLAFMMACGAAVDPTPATTTLTGITVARQSGIATVKVATGETLNLTSTFIVTPKPIGANLGVLSWTVDPKSGSSATASISGATLIAGSTAGDMTLTLKSGTGTTAKSATIDITIVAATLTSFTIEDPIGHALGTSLDLNTLTITTEPSGAVAGTLTWSIPTLTAGYIILSGSSLTSVVADATTLSVTVQASTAGTPPIVATKVITFPAPALTSIAVARTAGTGTDSVTVATGGTLDLANTFTVTPTPVIAAVGTLTWTVAAKTGSTATAAITDTTLTAGTIAGDMTLTVTSGTGTLAKSATFDISIAIALERLSLESKTGQKVPIVLKKIETDMTRVYDVTPTPPNADASVRWSIAGVTPYEVSEASPTITPAGLFTSPFSGEVLLQVTSTVNPEIFTATILRIGIQLSIKVAVNGPTMVTSANSITLDAVVTGNFQNQDVVWSLNPAVPGVSITTGGVLSVTDAVEIGTQINVNVTYTESTQTFLEAHKVTVQAPPPTNLEITRNELRETTKAKVGEAIDLADVFTVTPTPPRAKATVIWTVKTGSAAEATIAGTMITAITTGKITLVATSTIDDSVTREAMITAVIQPERFSIVRKMGQDNTKAKLGEQIDVTAIFDVIPFPPNADASVRWTVQAGSIGTITPEGMFTATVAGSTFLKVISTVNGITRIAGIVAITVVVNGPNMVTSTNSVTLAAVVSSGAQSNQNQDVVWSINPAVPGASITPAGVLSVTNAVSAGTSINVVATHTADAQTFIGRHVVTVVASSQQPPAAVERTNADLQGMIVGSTGHFYAQTTTAEKKMTIVLDGNTMHLNHDATASTATDLHFKTTDDRNTMVLNVPATGTPTVTSLNLMGHAGAVAEVTTVDHSTTTAATEVPLIFEGYETFYGIKRSDYTTPIDLATSEPTQAELDAKIELYRTHYNVVVKGGANAKLVVMANFITTEAEKTRLAGIWSAANIGYNPPFPEVAANNHPNKLEYTITSRSATEIVASATFTRPGSSNPETQTITFPITTDHGKLKMILPLQKLTDSVIFQDKTADMITRVKPLHAYFTREINSVVHYYRFPDYTSYNEFTSAPAYSAPGVALNDSLFNAIASFAASKGGTKVARDDAYETVFPEYQTYQYSESVLTEIR